MRYYRQEEHLDGLADVLRSLGDISRARGQFEVAKMQYSRAWNSTKSWKIHSITAPCCSVWGP